jgi:hypothetical protein
MHIVEHEIETPTLFDDTRVGRLLRVSLYQSLSELLLPRHTGSTGRKKSENSDAPDFPTNLAVFSTSAVRARHRGCSGKDEEPREACCGLFVDLDGVKLLFVIGSCQPQQVIATC